MCDCVCLCGWFRVAFVDSHVCLFVYVSHFGVYGFVCAFAHAFDLCVFGCIRVCCVGVRIVFSDNARPFTFASFVDNLYSTGRNAHDAIKLLQFVAFDLKQKWGVDIKPTSCCVITAIGGNNHTILPSPWKHGKVGLNFTCEK